MFQSGESGHSSDVSPQYEDACQVYNTSTLAASPGDPIGRIARMAGSFDWSQSTSGLRGTLGRFPDVGIRNRLSNNMMVGAVAGAPGTLPPGWSVGGGGLGTLTQTISGPTVIDGLTYIGYRLNGTTSTTSVQLNWSTTTAIDALTAQAWTNSAYVYRAAGASTNITSIGLCLTERTSAGGFVAQNNSVFDLRNVTAAARATYSATLSGGGTVAKVQGGLLISFSSGVAIDITIYVAVPQMELATAASAVQNVASADNITESGYPSLYLPYFNGSQWLTASTGTFGTASLFADVGQSWTVWGVSFAQGVSAGTLVSKAGETTTSRTLFVAAGGTTSYAYFWIRGTYTEFPADSFSDGPVHVWALRWDGTSLKWYFDKKAAQSVTVGAAAEEAVNITLNARAAGTSPRLGYNAASTIDRAYSDAEMTQLMSNLNSTYRKYL